MSNRIFGWGLLYSTVSEDIKSNSDVLLCLTHLVLVTEGFQCIGLGDSRNIDGTEETMEGLPKGWNEVNQLRYVYKGKLYNLQATKLDDGIMINLVRVDEQNVSMIQFNNRAVASRRGTLNEMIPTNEDIIKLIKEQLINKVTKSTKSKETSSQTASNLRKGPTSTHSLSTEQFDFRDLQNRPESHVGRGLGVGYNDLYPAFSGPSFQPPGGSLGPLGTGGGGMIFTPPHLLDQRRTGLPRGALPPGARFDHFRPPDADRFQGRGRPNPDNDEFPPPGFDDMFT